MTTTLPFSPFRQSGNLLFLSGQVGQGAGKIVSSDFGAQFEKTISNITSILEQKGLGVNNIIDVTAFLTDQSDYAVFNELYPKYFNEPFPTRTTVTVKSLPLGARVELKVIASL